jgi:hygromycin-B 7''-O-kinase
VRSLLPSVGPNGEYVRRSEDTPDAWLPGVQEIAARNGIRADTVIRFARGENPVFSVNESVVVKLLPRRSARLALREMACLEWLAQCKTIPFPTLLGSGQLEDWSYLLSTKLPGRPLSERWAGIPGTAQEAVAAELGRLMATLHQIPLGDFAPGGIQWQDFVARSMSAWTGRPSVGRLSSRLRDAGAEFIAGTKLNQSSSSPVFLHGDLAPENCLVAEVGGEWRITGIFDFGNAMAGHAPFDFTALTVLMAPGNAKVLRRFFEGYGISGSSPEELRSELMVYTLLHPLGDVSQLLGLIPGLDQLASWDEIARAFWPPAAFR